MSFTEPASEFNESHGHKSYDVITRTRHSPQPIVTYQTSRSCPPEGGVTQGSLEQKGEGEGKHKHSEVIGKSGVGTQAAHQSGQSY